ncbi:hypothetical protein [Sandaracinus amylolyticus]|uniref:hypothetical protein n=1 Tax=Sandaracinus amylolyticus TaxID=927083 RepID=UPI001F306D7A|nr:hypothetical protein [Sandaracinus amylolyticus]UJR81561.1 Hypothetical protein I5071_36210 [Sandaracinus amylolyticus]
MIALSTSSCIAASHDAPAPITTGAPSPPSTPRWERPPSAPADVTWPAPEVFEATRASLGRAITLGQVAHAGHWEVAFARRTSEGWELVGITGEASYDGTLCDSFPCAWPRALAGQEPADEPSALPDALLDDVAYARTLLAFEGPLVAEPDEAETSDAPALVVITPEFERARQDPLSRIPDDAWDLDLDADQLPYLAPHLDVLRLRPPRRVFVCGLEMLSPRPRQIAFMRALAAAQAGRTGWAVEGWTHTIRRWFSPPSSPPRRHGRLLAMLGVDAARLVLGLSIELTGHRRVLSLSEVRRVVADLGGDLVARLRTLAADPAVDPLNRVLAIAAVAAPPLSSDPLYATLPDSARALLDAWSR